MGKDKDKARTGDTDTAQTGKRKGPGKDKAEDTSQGQAQTKGKGKGKGTDKDKTKGKDKPSAKPVPDGGAARASADAPAGLRLPDTLSKADYAERLGALELELNGVARWLQATGQRLLVLIEGRDTAGKGGVISALSATLNPRQCHVVALGKPTERERSQWYFQRYVPHLPAAGEIVLFDRSWYNRAGVERVMGFCTEAETAAFLRQAPVFEQLLVDDGILLRKYWLTVDQAQQEQRFAERLADPLKRWKLSPIDRQAREKYAAYGQARNAMLLATHTAHAPWTLVDFNDQRRGRLALIRHLLDTLGHTDVPETPMSFPPLGHPPLVEELPASFRAL